MIMLYIDGTGKHLPGPSRKVHYWTGAVIGTFMCLPYRSAAKASAIAGKEVRRKWHKKFECRHPEAAAFKFSGAFYLELAWYYEEPEGLLI